MDLNPDEQTCTDLQLHSLVAKGQIQFQQDRARYVTEISLPGCNGSEDDSTSVVEFLLVLPPLHVTIETEVKMGIDCCEIH